MRVNAVRALPQYTAAPLRSQITAMCWAPNNRKLAVVNVDRVVLLFDENGERRDKFSTKPTDKGPKNYVVVGMAFSPDSTKLAVAQSDNIVFVYKLGAEWGEKKSICNKFTSAAPVTCLVWPSARPNDLVYAGADGKVKVGQIRTNKPGTLYSTEVPVVSMVASLDGNAIMCGHLDGTIYRFVFDDTGRGPAQSRFAVHACIPCVPRRPNAAVLQACD
jgi:intraflagellar transport protein 172